jgi:hypothetical protein
MAINQGTAAVGFQNREQQAQCRRFAGAVGADKTGNFAIVRGKYNAAQDLYVIETLAQALDFNHLPPPLMVFQYELAAPSGIPRFMETAWSTLRIGHGTIATILPGRSCPELMQN